MKNKKKLFLFACFLLAFFLRIYRFNEIPNSLFGDEVDTGYQAWSILKTGRDYFGNLMPVHFQSFGDWRMPLYIYLTVPFVALFGLTGLAVRLPSLLFSLASLPITYLLVKEISKKEKIALLTAFFLAISPWHFHFSRVAFEVTLFNFLFLLGLFLFLKGLRLKNGRLLIFSSISFAFSLYAYSTANLFIPLFLFFLILIFRQNLFFRQKIVGCFLIFLLIALPMGASVVFGEGGARFGSISIFSSSELPQRVDTQRRLCSFSGTIERLFHNKLWVFGEEFGKNYLKFFSVEYLFLRGDPNPRHNPLEKGQLYLIFLPFILIGGAIAGKKFLESKDKKLLLPFLILLITPIPAALTLNGGTHAIRTYQSLPWWQFLAAWGLMSSFSYLKNSRQKKGFLICFGLTLVFSSVSFFHLYFSHLPRFEGGWWRWWGYGYREVFIFVDKVESDFDEIYVSPSHDPPIVYSLFYHRYPPEKFQTEVTVSANGFGKFLFANPDLSFLKTGEKKEKILFVVTPGMVEAMGYRLEDYDSIEILEKIDYPDGEPVFYIFKTK